MTPKYTTDHIRSEVKKMIGEVSDLSPDQITDTANFVDDLGIDSLSAIEMLVSMEKKYGIVIPQEEFASIRNVDEAVAAVQRKIASV
jgi:acyl carrier protein